MTTLLIDNASCVATLDHSDPQLGREITNASVCVRGNTIAWIGPSSEVPQAWRDEAQEVIDARGHLVTPGLINTHHHMYQSLTRAIPGVQDAELFSWLRGLYPIWAGLTPEMVQAYFKHLVHGPVERFHLPGISAINYLLQQALDGGGPASSRIDPLGKGMGQMLLDIELLVPASVAAHLNN
jgi:hypothetical protein